MTSRINQPDPQSDYASKVVRQLRDTRNFDYFYKSTQHSPSPEQLCQILEALEPASFEAAIYMKHLFEMGYFAANGESLQRATELISATIVKEDVAIDRNSFLFAQYGLLTQEAAAHFYAKIRTDTKNLYPSGYQADGTMLLALAQGGYLEIISDRTLEKPNRPHADSEVLIEPALSDLADHFVSQLLRQQDQTGTKFQGHDQR